MNIGELLKEVAEENQTRKILEMVEESKDLAEAIEKIKALLNKQQSKHKNLLGGLTATL